MKYSSYQNAVFEFIKNEKGSALIEAVAGSGKTSTLIEALKIIPASKKVTFFAFSKAIQQELSQRVPKGVKCSTFHAACFAALQRTEFKGFRVDTSKSLKIIRSFELHYEPKLLKRIMPQALKLISLAKANGLAPKDSELQSLFEDKFENWEKLIDHHDLIFDNCDDKKTCVNLCRKVLAESLKMTDVLDFDDLLYICALREDISFFKPDFIFVDEAQDVSEIQRALLAKMLKKNGRLIAVGDRAQAIFGFRGADSASLEKIAKQFNCTRLPLSICYRCPKSVIREAQNYAAIEAFDQAIEGAVERLGSYDHVNFKAKDMVICRNTAPLIRLAYNLVSKRVPITFLGKEMGKTFIKLIEKLNAFSIENLEDKLLAWQQKEHKRLLKRDPDADLSKVDDQVDSLITFIEHSSAQTVEGLKTAINSLFNSRDGGVILSTIHKAKGLEAKHVFILDAWLLPSKYAKKPWQMQQETNLLYVAITRAQETLSYISSPQRD